MTLFILIGCALLNGQKHVSIFASLLFLFVGCIRGDEWTPDKLAKFYPGYTFDPAHVFELGDIVYTIKYEHYFNSNLKFIGTIEIASKAVVVEKLLNVVSRENNGKRKILYNVYRIRFEFEKMRQYDPVIIQISGNRLTTDKQIALASKLKQKQLEKKHRVNARSFPLLE